MIFMYSSDIYSRFRTAMSHEITIFWENSVETLPKYCVKWERTKEEKQTKKKRQEY